MKHFLSLLLAALAAVSAFAATPLPPPPAGQEYRYDAIANGVYTNTRLYPTAVTPPPNPGACTVPGLTRITQTNVGYGPSGLNSSRLKNTTEWQDVFGYSSLTQTVPQPFGTYQTSSPLFPAFKRGGFMALHFNSGKQTAASFGALGYLTFAGGPDITVSISTRCGDFDAQARPACRVTAIPSDDGNHFGWTGNSANNVKCPLAPDTDYYLNIKYTDPNSRTECASGVQCAMLLSRAGNP